MKYSKKTRLVVNLSPVENKKPTNDPNAALKAIFLFAGLCINSPEKAPINGPNRSPRGPKNSPTNNPMVAPQIPFFDPPKLFAPRIGITKSNKVTAIAIASVIHKKFQSVGMSFVNCRSNKPSHPAGGPGTMGKKAPIIPKIMKKNPKRMSR